MNFIVYGIDRSRTRWLSEFLTCYDHSCEHDLAPRLRQPQDIYDYFSQPNVGSCETGSSQAYHIIEHACPGIKTVVVKRDLEEVMNSILKLDLSGIATYDPVVLRKHLMYGQRMLDKISKRPDVLTLNFSDLGTEEGCKSVFEHCLPYEFNRDWYMYLKDKNIQVDVRKTVQYFLDHKTEIDNFKRLLKHHLRYIRETDPMNPIFTKAG